MSKQNEKQILYIDDCEIAELEYLGSDIKSTWGRYVVLDAYHSHKELFENLAERYLNLEDDALSDECYIKITDEIDIIQIEINKLNLTIKNTNGGNFKPTDLKLFADGTYEHY